MELSQVQEEKSCIFSHMWNTDLIQIQQYYEKHGTMRRSHM
jgi:hypothetical protein